MFTEKDSYVITIHRLNERLSRNNHRQPKTRRSPTVSTSNAAKTIDDFHEKDNTVENWVPPCPGGVSRQGGAGEAQTRISCASQLVNYGIDTLYMTLDAAIPGTLLVRLMEAKKAVQAGNGELGHICLNQSDIFSFNIQRQGAKRYPYVLRSGDVTISFATRQQGSSIPNMQIQIGSMSCQEDCEGVVRKVKMWLRHLGVVWGKKGEKVSRIDLAADYAIAIDDTLMSDMGRHVGRATKTALFYSGKKLSGVQVGTGCIVLRCYDKLKEMADKQATNKQEFFANLWGGMPEHVTRVEFQLRREAITTFLLGLTDFDTVYGRLADVWLHVTGEWFRQAANVVDRKNRNQGRAKDSVFWTRVKSAWSKVPPKKALKRRSRAVHVSVQRLLGQARGCMVSAAAALGHLHSDVFGIMATIHDTMKEQVFAAMELPTWEQDYQRRQTRARVSF